MNMNQYPVASGRHPVGRVMGALAAVGLTVGLVSTMGGEDGPKTMTAATAVPTTEGSTTTSLDSSTSVVNVAPASTTPETTTTLSASELDALRELFSTEIDDLTFECEDEGAATGVIEVVTPSGSSNRYVVPRRNFNLPVNGDAAMNDNERETSDAPTVPAIGDTAEQLNEANSANGCEDVNTLFASLNFIAEFPLPSGIKVSELNEFFKKFEGDADYVQALATEYILAIERMATPEDLAAYNFVQDAARRFAAFKQNYDLVGVQVAEPERYFHLKDLGADKNDAGVPKTEIVNGSYGDNPNTVAVENQFVVLRGTTKVDGCVYEWLINPNDQRLGVAKNDECEMPPVVTTTTAPGSTTTTPNTTPATTSTTTTSTTSTSTTVPNTAPPTTVRKGAVPTTVVEECSEYVPCP